MAKKKDTPKVRVWPETYRYLIRRAKRTGRNMPTTIDDMRKEVEQKQAATQTNTGGAV